MARRLGRWLKAALSLLAWLLPLSQCNSRSSAEPPGVLQFERALQWDQKRSGRLVFAPDGKTVAGYGLDWIDDPSLASSLRLWSVSSGMTVHDLNVAGAYITSIAFGHDGLSLFSGSWDGTVRVHDLRTLKTEVIPDAGGQEIRISPDGTWLAGTAANFVWRADLASKKTTATRVLEHPMDVFPCPIALSHNGKVIAIACQARFRVKVNEVALCDARNLASFAFLRNDASPVTSLSYSPDGSLLAIGDRDGGVAIWDGNTVKRKRKVGVFTDPGSKTVGDVVFSPDGKLLGVGGIGTALLLSVDTLEVVDRVKGQGGFTLAFSPDGRLLLTGNSPFMDGRHDIRLWRVGKH